MDEFYSGYLYTHGCNGETVSSASYVEGTLFNIEFINLF